MASRSKQTLAQGAVAAELVGLASPGHPAAVEHGGTIGNRERNLGILLHDEGGNALAL